MLRVVDKAGKPGVGLLSPAHFRRAGLGADRQVPELGLPILAGHIVAHHLFQLPAGLLSIDGIGVLAVGKGRRNGRSGDGLPLHQFGHHRHAVIGNAPHKGQHIAGVDQVFVLPHTRPAQKGASILLGHKASFGGMDVADCQGIQQARLLHVLSQGLAPQLHGQGGIGPIAGGGQTLLDVHILAVGIGTGDDISVHFQTASAGIAELVQVLLLLNGRRRGHQLKDRAGGIGAGKEPIQIHPLIGGVLVDVRRGIVGVVGGGAHLTQQVSRGIVIHRHHPLASVEGGVGRLVEGRINGEGHVMAAQGGAGDQIIACQPAGQH